MNKKLRLPVIIFGILIFITGIVLLILDIVRPSIAIPMYLSGIALIISTFKFMDKFY